MDLIKGTLDVLVLEALETSGPMHGYNVTRWIHQRSGGILEVEDAALYQALHRLEGRGLLEARWGRSDNNRKAKYYRITRKGRKERSVQATAFRTYTSAVLSVIGKGARA